MALWCRSSSGLRQTSEKYLQALPCFLSPLHRYRCNSGIEQWLIKWQDYNEVGNTWEPWANLLTEAVQAEAHKVKEAALPSVAKLLTVPLLKATLEERGLDSGGLKAALVQRLQEALTPP